MKIIFAGSIARLPVGGHAWVDLQYLIGLKELGHTVCYLEDCGKQSWVYNWQTQKLTSDLNYPTEYLRDCLSSVAWDEKWIYRTSDHSVGLNLEEFLDLCSQADLLIVRGSPLSIWRSEYDLPRKKIYIDSDPGFTQFKIANGDKELNETVNHCNRLFTIGQNIGRKDCLIPDNEREWLKFPPPIALSHWPVETGKVPKYFTSILQWRSYEEIIYDGISFGNKNKEFPKYFTLPELSKQHFQLALTGLPREKMSGYGWDVLPGWETTFTPASYQAFIQGSRAEFSVAKHGYVLTRGGWFSDRSICYLSSGRPVLVQDTGQKNWLPIGEGILTFSTLAEAIEGVEAINSDYEKHQTAARKLAEEYFSSEKILNYILENAMY